MKVKDILNELAEMDPESDVWFEMFDGCCTDLIDLNSEDMELNETVGMDGTKVVRFTFPAIDLLRSCIRSGKAHNAVYGDSK